MLAELGFELTSPGLTAPVDNDTATGTRISLICIQSDVIMISDQVTWQPYYLTKMNSFGDNNDENNTYFCYPFPTMFLNENDN